MKYWRGACHHEGSRAARIFRSAYGAARAQTVACEMHISCAGAPAAPQGQIPMLSRVSAPPAVVHVRANKERHFTARLRKHIKKRRRNKSSRALEKFSPQNLLKSNKNSHDPGNEF